MTPLPQKPLELRTDTRDEFIAVFETLAKGVPHNFLQDPFDLQLVEISGPIDCGKSLGVETMIKTWSDEHNLQSLLRRENDHMFMESRPREAVSTVSATFNVAGRPTMFAFNSTLYTRAAYHDLVRNMKDAGGGIFFCTYPWHTKAYGPCEMLQINIRDISMRGPWLRSIEIHPQNPRLWARAQFQECWEKLEQQATQKMRRTIP